MLVLDAANPVNRSHRLNLNRESWWLTPHVWSRFSPTSSTHLDLMGVYDGVNSNCTYRRGDDFQPQLDIGAGGNITFGNHYNYTDEFTIGASFETRTLTPGGGGGGGAVIIGKNIGSGSNGWVMYQVGQTINTNGVSSGSVLALANKYRCICSFTGGNATIYLNGAVVATGPHTVGSTTDTMRIGIGIDNFTWQFDGWAWDCFVSSRPWSAGDVALDYELSQHNYQGLDSPLRYVSQKRTLFAAPAIVSLASNVVLDSSMLFASPARLGGAVNAYASASGIGPIVPEGPAFFLSDLILGGAAQGGIPTLVSLASNVILDGTIAVGAPASLESQTILKANMRSIPDGNLKVLAQKRYRR